MQVEAFEGSKSRAMIDWRLLVGGIEVRDEGHAGEWSGPKEVLMALGHTLRVRNMF